MTVASRNRYAKLKMRIRRPHPLADAVVAAFRGRRVHDRITLADDLTLGFSHVRGSYLRVAADVLQYMEARGDLTRDAEGWYHLNEKSTFPDLGSAAMGANAP